MGNEETSNARTYRNSSLQRNNPETLESKSLPRRKRNFSTLNQSEELKMAAQQYASIENEPRTERILSKQQIQNDRVLEVLSKKNEQLRRELRGISEKLSDNLKRKKFVPKRKEELEDSHSAGIETNGLKKELENGYRQIDMYKRTLEALRVKEDNQVMSVKANKLQSEIAEMNTLINLYLKRIEGVKKVTHHQDKNIERDMGEEANEGMDSLKTETEALRTKLKDITARAKQKEFIQKKQQAYLVEIQQKWQEMRGGYFPGLKKKPATTPAVVKSSKNKPQTIPKTEIDEINAELPDLRAKHEDYHRKLDAILIFKNKVATERNQIIEKVNLANRTIQHLKLKLISLRKFNRPPKRNLFGVDNYDGSELQSEFNGGVSEIEQEMQERANQDLFQIKHLLANIPKPVKSNLPEEDHSRRSKGKKGTDEAKESGMIVSERGEPKRWGSALTRSEEKGMYFKKQVIFEDNPQQEAGIKPLMIGMNAWVNKNNSILALQAIYLVKDEIRYGNKSSTVDGFLVRYDLQSPDYLKNVTGTFSEEGFLESLALYSKQGKTACFGIKRASDEIFTFGLASTERPFRMKGATSYLDAEPRINRIEFDICEE